MKAAHLLPKLAEAGFRHSSDGWHYRRGGLDPVKDASEARAGEAGAPHP
jgi:hypothetical protein